jgi:hypothetical protein
VITDTGISVAMIIADIIASGVIVVVDDFPGNTGEGNIVNVDIAVITGAGSNHFSISGGPKIPAKMIATTPMIATIIILIITADWLAFALTRPGFFGKLSVEAVVLMVMTRFIAE